MQVPESYDPDEPNVDMVDVFRFHGAHGSLVQKLMLEPCVPLPQPNPAKLLSGHQAHLSNKRSTGSFFTDVSPGANDPNNPWPQEGVGFDEPDVVTSIEVVRAAKKTSLTLYMKGDPSILQSGENNMSNANILNGNTVASVSKNPERMPNTDMLLVFRTSSADCISDQVCIKRVTSNDIYDRLDSGNVTHMDHVDYHFEMKGFVTDMCFTPDHRYILNDLCY